VDEAKLSYDPTRQENLENAVRYLIQRGLTIGAIAYGGAYDYALTLDPPLFPTYNNFLVLCVVPEITNAGPVRLNVNGRGLVPLVRNDGLNLQPDDFRAGIPILIGYMNGYFYMLSFARSQVPQPLTGDVNAWIRTDGNDNTGDGTANSPDKAFRTINGCWQRLSKRYLPSMVFTIHMRLGIPGRYEAAQIGPYGGQVALHGAPANPNGYRIMMQGGGDLAWCLVASGMSFFIEGVTFEFSINAPQWHPSCVYSGWGAQWTMSNCNFDASVNPGKGSFITCWYGGALELLLNTVNFNGNGVTLNSAILCTVNSSYFTYGATDGVAHLNVSNMNFTTAFVQADNLSTAHFGTIAYYGCTGPRYFASANSIIGANGQSLPGTLPGSVSYGAQFIP